MKRCYFIGLDSVYDAGIDSSLFIECEKIIQQNEQVEFWFFRGEMQSYISSCLRLVTLLKAKYPEKDIQIVKVLAPVKNDVSLNWFKEAYNKAFPLSLADKNISIPGENKEAPENENTFTLQINKIERWILRQMDVVLAYYYSNLEDSVLAQITYTKNFCAAEIVHIYFDDTEKFIQEQAETMFDKRTTLILSLYREKLSQKEISKAAGVSCTRVSQIAHKAARDIRSKLIRRYGGENIKDQKCGLCCLSNDTNALQLVVFQNLLEYLADKYQVKEFWIDERSCNTPYGAILAKFCAQSYGLSAKVVVCCDKEDSAIWDNITVQYIPPYRSVINLGIEMPEKPLIYEEILRQCSCVITDFSDPDAQIIRELCARSGRNYLFDLPQKHYLRN